MEQTRTIFLVWTDRGDLLVATRSWWSAHWVQLLEGGTLAAVQMTDTAHAAIMSVARY